MLSWIELKRMWVTKVTITEIEFQLGFTTTTDAFIEVCQLVANKK